MGIVVHGVLGSKQTKAKPDTTNLYPYTMLALPYNVRTATDSRDEASWTVGFGVVFADSRVKLIEVKL